MTAEPCMYFGSSDDVKHYYTKRQQLIYQNVAINVARMEDFPGRVVVNLALRNGGEQNVEGVVIRLFVEPGTLTGDAHACDIVLRSIIRGAQPKATWSNLKLNAKDPSGNPAWEMHDLQCEFDDSCQTDFIILAAASYVPGPNLPPVHPDEAFPNVRYLAQNSWCAIHASDVSRIQLHKIEFE